MKPGQLIKKLSEPSPARQLIQTALGHHQTGRLAQAEALYRQVLQIEPDNPDALHLLGALARQAGEPAVAADFIRRAIHAKPSEPVFYNSLGLVLRDLGRLDEGAASYRKAISIKPDYVETHYNLGNVLQLQGRLDEAVASYRKALSLKPDYAEAHCNLGSALQAQGKLDDAAASYRRAISLKPNHAEAHCNLGNALQQQGKLDEAIASYRMALASKPDYAKAHGNLGKTLQEQGKFDEAITCYRTALALKPDIAEMHCNLGGALRGKGAFDAAIASYRQALALKPDLAEAYSGLGNVFREQGKLDEAGASFRQAIALKPDFAKAYNGLGCILQTQGKLEEAIAHLQQALQIQPDYAEAHTVLAAVYIDQGRFDSARAELARALRLEPDNPNAWAAQAALQKMTTANSEWLHTALRLVTRSSPALSAMETVKLHFAIGKYYDDTGQFDLAFSSYQQANALKRQREGAFGRAGFSRLIDTLIATYSADFIGRQHAGASPSALPVLIVGMPRSGTSLLEQIIASHPQAYGAGELPFWDERFAAHQAEMLSGNFGATLIADAAAAYESLLRRHSAAALRIVDKMPGNFLWAGLIHLTFPQARIIHARRNPVDTCLSIYFQNLMPSHSYGTNLDDLAFYYREYSKLMRYWRSVLPADRFLEMSYEELTDNQAVCSRRIIEFIGLEWDERCLDFHKTERKVGTSSNWQVRQKIYHSSRARWRNYEKHLGPLLGLLELE
ncbi:MAG: tetratricopeptide repeat protein [Gallionellaceae bacterium]